jgi:HNH endonuclease
MGLAAGRRPHMRVKEPIAAVAEERDYLFNWNPEKWPHEELRKLVDTFDSNGIAEEPWACAAYRKIRLGDRAYLLKVGKPLGIFGRGHVVGKPQKWEEAPPGRNPWQVPIRFDVSWGDVLWDPVEHLLVDEKQLLRMPAAQRFKMMQKGGETLNPDTAREIDNIIDDSILLGRGRASPVDEAAQEIVRLKKLIEQATRPDQRAFSEIIRRNYRCKCAVTECVTPAALEAAHIRVQRGVDDNSPANGILLRSDIHALFDSLLITLSEDGTRIEVGPELADQSYAFLQTTVVTRPDQEPPSAANIREHRNRFLERQKRRSGY